MDNDHCYYGGDPSEYEAFRDCAPHHDQLQASIPNILRERLGETPKLLEIGCGTGLTTRSVLQHIPGARITAVDCDVRILEVARQKVGEHSTVTYIAEDIVNFLEHTSRQYDGVYSAYCIHNIVPTDRLKLFARVSRALKTGGVFVNADKAVRNDVLEYWSDLKAGIDGFQVFRGTPRAHLEALWVSHYLADDHIRFTEDEQRALMPLAGLQSITLHSRWGLDAVMSGVRV